MAQIRALSQYPAETRKAVLELSQYPELVTALATAKSEPARLAAIAAAPAEARAPAAKVLQYSGLVEILNQDIRLTTLVGRVYRDHKAIIDAIGAELEKQTAAQQSDSADRWAARLAADEAALRELLAALKKRAEETGSKESGDGVTQTDGKTVVYATPTEETTRYILDRAGEYAQVAAALIQQWLEEYAASEYADGTGTGGTTSSSSGSDGSSGGGRTGDYGSAVSDWWNTYGSYIPADAVATARLADYVKETARAGEELRGQLGGRALTREALTGFLKRNSDRYPLTGKEAFRAGPGTRAPSPRTKPADPAVGKKPPFGDGPPVGKKPPFGPRWARPAARSARPVRRPRRRSRIWATSPARTRIRCSRWPGRCRRTAPGGAAACRWEPARASTCLRSAGRAWEVPAPAAPARSDRRGAYLPCLSGTCVGEAR